MIVFSASKAICLFTHKVAQIDAGLQGRPSLKADKTHMFVQKGSSVCFYLL